jgi:2-polyprenyl-6-methoxyphenol hydroxylase-like FAD-dependent oxidoreductase
VTGSNDARPCIAIVGGGVGGLAAALALERRGAEIVVCEQSPALNEIGAGLNLSPNALMALRVLGVEDAVIALGSESDFLIIRSWKSGRVISRMRRGAFRQQFGAPNLTGSLSASAMKPIKHATSQTKFWKTAKRASC